MLNTRMIDQLVSEQEYQIDNLNINRRQIYGGNRRGRRYNNEDYEYDDRNVKNIISLTLIKNTERILIDEEYDSFDTFGEDLIFIGQLCRTYAKKLEEKK